MGSVRRGRDGKAPETVGTAFLAKGADAGGGGPAATRESSR